MSHHEGMSEPEQRFFDQVLKKTRPAFPDGPLNRTDEGELAFAVATDPVSRVVLIHFGKPVVWCGMAKKQALELSALLKEHAESLP